MLEKLSKQEVDELINDLKEFRKTLVKPSKAKVDLKMLELVAGLNLDKAEHYKTNELLEVIGLERSRLNQMMFGTVMRKIGFIKKVVRDGSKTFNVWVFQKS